MELKPEAQEKPGSDEQVRKMLRDILYGLKAKMVQPVIEENWKLSAQMVDLKEEGRTWKAEMNNQLVEIMERLAALEAGLREVPILVLSSIRDAIDQTGGDS